MNELKEGKFFTRTYFDMLAELSDDERKRLEQIENIYIEEGRRLASNLLRSFFHLPVTANPPDLEYALSQMECGSDFLNIVRRQSFRHLATGSLPTREEACAAFGDFIRRSGELNQDRLTLIAVEDLRGFLFTADEPAENYFADIGRDLMKAVRFLIRKII